MFDSICENENLVAIKSKKLLKENELALRSTPKIVSIGNINYLSSVKYEQRGQAKKNSSEQKN